MHDSNPSSTLGVSPDHASWLFRRQTGVREYKTRPSRKSVSRLWYDHRYLGSFVGWRKCYYVLGVVFDAEEDTNRSFGANLTTGPYFLCSCSSLRCHFPPFLSCQSVQLHQRRRSSSQWENIEYIGYRCIFWSGKLCKRVKVNIVYYFREDIQQGLRFVNPNRLFLRVVLTSPTPAINRCKPDILLDYHKSVSRENLKACDERDQMMFLKMLLNAEHGWSSAVSYIHLRLQTSRHRVQNDASEQTYIQARAGKRQDTGDYRGTWSQVMIWYLTGKGEGTGGFANSIG